MGRPSPKSLVEGTRVCYRCGETKTLDQFPRHKHHPGGRMSTCKQCRNERVRNMRRKGVW